MVNVDPPIFVIAVTSPLVDAKDTLRNFVESQYGVRNVVREGFVEAANATNIDAPYGVTEWAISALTPAYDRQTVKCARVTEPVFSVKAKLESVREFPSQLNPGTTSGSLELVEGNILFWARENAPNEDEKNLDLAIYASDLREEHLVMMSNNLNVQPSGIT